MSSQAGAIAAAEPGSRKQDPILVAEGVRKTFGGLVAVDVAHLEIQRGAITALIGPNGAGKTTFFNVITGFERADAGRWQFEERAVHRMPPHRIAHRGLVRTFQLTKVLGRMTVLQNMMLAAPSQRGERFGTALFPPLWRAREREIEERAEALLAEFGLTRMRSEYAATLSGGQRKLLEMARALMVEPTMIMLDEPVAGVNPVLKETILTHVMRLRDGGMTVLFVEHDMDVVMGISNWVVCMATGRIIAEGPPGVCGANPAVIDAYLGTRHDDPAAGEAAPEAATESAPGPAEAGEEGSE